MLLQVVCESLIGVVIGFTFYLSQYVFYSGNLYERYGFPAEYTWFLVIAGLTYRFTKRPFLSPWSSPRGRAVARRFAYTIAFLPAILCGPHHVAVDAKTRIEDTQTLKRFVDRVAEICKKDPTRPVVIEAVNPYSCEQALQGFPKALRHAQVTNPFYHRFTAPDEAATKKILPYFQACIPVMVDVSKNGGYGFLAWPKDEKQVLGKAVIITMDADQPQTAGEFAGRVPWKW
ncbi:MAG: hypothetical protein U0903_00585 [Planctomycetales bacterium]